ncbi:DUF6220 domain-containing protein [Gracilibacillus phocaeensis]|uniref:DUF6220 domain-containing protein n=1 Tax=Gracilibacillus phocaeensis TaxID=2042304 RepID=UPI0010320045|nr:DUF6220 domain-containing protein [Gracilibacillus phocaeensis]
MRIKIAEMTFIILLGLFLMVVFAQFILAGLAVFADPAQWRNHTMLIHLFGFNLPLILLVFAWLGKMKKRVYLQVLDFMVLIFLMYFTANIAGKMPWFAALHPIVGVLLFIGTTLLMVQQIYSYGRRI